MNIINDFEEKQSVKKVLRDAEIDVIKKYYYCKSCKKYDKFYSVKSDLEKMGFFTFNKQIKYWDVKDPEFHQSNRNFEVRPIRDPRFRM